MAGRVFVTGGSGFVGCAVIDELLRRQYAVTALTRSADLDTREGRVTSVPGDLFDEAALAAGMRGCDAVIHLVGIIMEKPGDGVTFEQIHTEGTRAVVDAARRAGVRRYVHMSALGSRADAPSRYHQTKYAAEQIVRDSGLDWTIFRPSMIHGPRGEFIQMAANWARKQAMPVFFMPYFGAGLIGLGGAGLLQPVYVGDVARAFVDALEKPVTFGGTYEIAGPAPMTWPDLHHAIAEAVVGKRRWVAPLPAWYATALTYIVPRRMLPFNRDQVMMSQEDNTCDLGKFIQDFGWEPRPFRPALETYAKQL